MCEQNANTVLEVRQFLKDGRRLDQLPVCERLLDLEEQEKRGFLVIKMWANFSTSLFRVLNSIEVNVKAYNYIKKMAILVKKHFLFNITILLWKANVFFID